MIKDDIKQKIVNTINHYEKVLLEIREESTALISSVYQSMEILEPLVKTPKDTENFENLRVFLGQENALAVVMEKFNQWLNELVVSISDALTNIEQKDELSSSKSEGDKVLIDVNESLIELLHNLSIPVELDDKLLEIKESLKKQLTVDGLRGIIDDLTALVGDALEVEKKRYMVFLKQFGAQLSDFENHLKTIFDQNKQAKKDSDELEIGVDSNLNQIKDHIDNSKTIEELASKVSENLALIGNRIKVFRENEAKRIKLSEKKITELQAKLEQSEQEAQEMKEMVFSQTYNVNHDSLTGIANRRAYSEHIKDSYNRWKRNGGDYIVAIADIDHFKQINDTFGHLAGDKVLKKIAILFKSSIRVVDFVARYGGEEFVFIFENTPVEDGLLMLDKLRESVESCQFVYKDQDVDVRVSFGITKFASGDDIDTVFARADKALYQAKNNGRNQVVAM